MDKQTAKSLSHYSGVAREVVYRTLKNLKEKGFVEEILTSPKTFRTIPEEDAYAIMLQQKEKENTELRIKVQQTLERKKDDRKNFVTIHEEEVVRFSPEKTNYRLKMFWTNVENCVDMIIPCKKFVRWGKYDLVECLEGILKKKVTINVVTEKETKKHLENKEVFPQKLAETVEWINFKFVEKLPEVEMVVFDKRHINIALKKEEHLKDMHFLYSNNPFLAEIANKYFENLWLNI